MAQRTLYGFNSEIVFNTAVEKNIHILSTTDKKKNLS